MGTVVNKATKPAIISEELKSSLVLMDTLKAIGQCKITKDEGYVIDKTIHPLLDKAFNEVQKQRAELRDYTIELYLRNLFFTFSIQRQHNLWKQESIKSAEIGSQMRNVGRSITRWLANNMSEWLYARDKNGYLYNLNLLVEYANYDLLTHNQIRTKTSNGKTGSLGSKKTPNKIIAHETMNIPQHLVVELMTQNLRASKGLSLIARWLPKYTSAKSRTTILIAGKDIKKKVFDATGKPWVKINDQKFTHDSPVVEKWSLPIKDGDKITYPRAIQTKTLERIEKDNQFITSFNQAMGWDLKRYNAFRHEYMEKTPEHQFSSGKITEMKKDQFEIWLAGLSAGQQWVVSSTLCYKDASGNLAPKPTGRFINTQLPVWYIAFSKKDEKKADEVRIAMAAGDTLKVKELSKEIKVKTTGIQTIDLLVDIMTGKKTESQVNTLHTALLAKMQMDVPVYCIIDGSASMNSPIRVGQWVVKQIDIALTLAITFMVTNPVEEYRSSCMWFGSEATFTGVTKYANTAPNSYLIGARYQKVTGPRKVVDPASPFTENLMSIRQANPGIVSSTNAGLAVQTFMKLVQDGKMHSEDLPRVLIFVTDEEFNTGLEPTTPTGTGFTQIPQSIGWNPLFVFWGLKTTAGLDKYKNAPNCMVTRGFEESNLTQILQFIRKGAINMFDELFAVHEMPGLLPIKYPYKG